MAKILFLTQRIPFPPNKGDKLRSYRVLAHWAKRHDVFLGCFIDDPRDREHVSFMRELCSDAHFASLHPALARLRSMSALFANQPMTLPYYRDHRLAAWVERVIARERPTHAYVFSSSMTQYLMAAPARPSRVLFDFVDVDSQKWADYAARTNFPANLVYAREARMLSRHERNAALWSDASIFVSEPEAALMRRLAPEASAKVVVVPNGVDCAYFSPRRAGARPPGGDPPLVVFTGHMDYWPNIDAAVWFADAILPRVRRLLPDATFAIVGANPSRAVAALGHRPGVIVTGTVTDVRPYVGHADVVVAPMRIGRGVQNKILEGMAMARTVVSTPLGLEGIDARAGKHLLVAQGEAEFADAVVAAAVGAPGASTGDAARAWLEITHDWAERLARYDRLLDG